MRKILLLSDTHSYYDEKITKYAEKADEIWHAGDIGDWAVIERLESIKPVRVVYGNIDDRSVQLKSIEDLYFECEQVKVFITHIGGYPDRYNLQAKRKIEAYKPNLFICGHSHILKVMPDKKYNLIHMNPGACGNHGFHAIKTMLQFTIDGAEIKDLSVVELGKRGY